MGAVVVVVVALVQVGQNQEQQEVKEEQGQQVHSVGHRLITVWVEMVERVEATIML
jgi:hypothetical protein